MNERNTGSELLNMDWHSLGKDVIRNFWTILLAGCILWMGTWVYAHCFYTPQYTSSSTVAVRAKLDSPGAYAGLAATSAMAKVFAEVFTQPSLKSLAAGNIGLDSFDGSVTAAVEEKTNVIMLSVTSSDPDRSFRLLQSILEVYPAVSDVIFTNAVITVLTAPEMSAEPSNPFPFVRYIQFAVLAMILEAGIVIFLSVLRNTVKNEQMFAEKIDAELLGTVAHEKPHMTRRERVKRIRRPLLMDDASASFRFSEDYQRLAARLEYEHSRNGAGMFTVTSTAEKEGTSTTAVNLALTLAARGFRVALLDLHIRKPELYRMFGVKSNIPAELSDVLAGERALSEFSFHRCKRSGLLLAFNKTCRTDSGNWLSRQHARHILSLIRERMDFVIIDSSPLSVSADAVHLSEMSDGTLLVVRTDKTAAEEINDAVRTISGAGSTLLGCILNDVHKPFTMFGQMGADAGGCGRYRYTGRYSAENCAKGREDDTFGHGFVGEQAKQEQGIDG